MQFIDATRVATALWIFIIQVGESDGEFLADEKQAALDALGSASSWAKSASVIDAARIAREDFRGILGQIGGRSVGEILAAAKTVLDALPPEERENVFMDFLLLGGQIASAHEAPSPAELKMTTDMIALLGGSRDEIARAIARRDD